MIPYPDIDPVAIELGPLKIRWYGLTYLVGFALAWILMRYRANQSAWPWQREQVEDLIFFAALGVILGGRLGYVLFYGFDQLVGDPMYLLRIWEGGMSFHGGLIGVLVAVAIYARRRGRGFFEVTDFIAPAVAPGLFCGRIGNFINGELWGRPSELPWAFVVDGEGRHPSQLYEAALEGLVLFLIVWVYSARPRPRMAVSGLFALCYGLFRFAVEFVREPDSHLQYLALGWVTMGQVLSAPLILVGALLLVLAYRDPKEYTMRAEGT